MDLHHTKRTFRSNFRPSATQADGFLTHNGPSGNAFQFKHIPCCCSTYEYIPPPTLGYPTPRDTCQATYTMIERDEPASLRSKPPKRPNIRPKATIIVGTSRLSCDAACVRQTVQRYPDMSLWEPGERVRIAVPLLFLYRDLDVEISDWRPAGARADEFGEGAEGFPCIEAIPGHAEDDERGKRNCASSVSIYV